MSKTVNYPTLSEKINELRAKGYTEDFNLKEDCVHCNDEVLYPEEFHIDEYYRFEGSTDPSDQSILYAISSVKDKHIKGVLVNGYGIYADTLTNKMIEKLKTN